MFTFDQFRLDDNKIKPTSFLIDFRFNILYTEAREHWMNHELNRIDKSQNLNAKNADVFV